MEEEEESRGKRGKVFLLMTRLLYRKPPAAHDQIK